MRPVTDKFKISREKLAYIIDSTAAAVCIIAPISSWAAAVSSIAPEGEGLNLLICSIPYNLYALLTLLCVVVTSVMGLDFSKMRMVELAAASKESEENAAADEIKGTVLKQRVHNKEEKDCILWVGLWPLMTKTLKIHLRQHRAMGAAGFGGSLAPIV